MARKYEISQLQCWDCNSEIIGLTLNIGSIDESSIVCEDCALEYEVDYICNVCEEEYIIDDEYDCNNEWLCNSCYKKNKEVI